MVEKEIDRRKLFPKEVKTDTPNLVKDLMPLKIGVVYNHITESYLGSKIYWYLPLMASCSKGHVGDMNA